MLSVTALLDAVVKVCPAAKVVLVRSGVSTDHTTDDIVFVPKNLDQSTL